jgi:hypothetical protein
VKRKRLDLADHYNDVVTPQPQDTEMRAAIRKLGNSSGSSFRNRCWRRSALPRATPSTSRWRTGASSSRFANDEDAELTWSGNVAPTAATRPS